MPPPPPARNNDSSVVKKNQSDSNFLNRLLYLIPFEIHVTYDIVTDGRFMIVNAKLDSAANESARFQVNSTDDDEAVIDIENQLIFYTRSRQLKKMKLYTMELLQNDTTGCMHHKIAGKSQGYTVTLCKSIPHEIIPPILFADRSFGVKAVTTPNLTVVLSYFRATAEKDKRLIQYAKYFTQYPVKGIEEGFIE